MARKLTDEQLATIRAHAKLPVRTIARLKPASAPPARPKKTPAVSVPAPAEGTPVERLERAVAALEHAAQQAAADGDQARVVAALRAVSDVTKTIAVLTPPAAVDPNDRPDFIKAAKDCRKAWLDHIERVIADEITP